MYHPVIHIPDKYLLIVDENYKLGAMVEWAFNKATGNVMKTTAPSWMFPSKEESKWHSHNKKIIAHLPLNDSPVLKGVPTLPELPADDEFAKALKRFPINMVSAPNSKSDYFPYDTNENDRGVWIEDYRAATKKYSEEDMRKAIEMARVLTDRERGKQIEFDIESIMGMTEIETSVMDVKFTPDQIIQSLLPSPIPVGFEPEMIDGYNVEFVWFEKLEPKIINNQWQGKWVYQNH